MKQYLNLTDVSILDGLPKLTEDRENKPWLPEEQAYFIVGIDLMVLASCLPGRSDGAISREASKPKFEYGTKTINSVKYLVEGIKRRKRKKVINVDTDIAVSDTDTITSSATLTALETIKSESNVIVSDNEVISKTTGLEANNLAVEILQTYALPIHPDVVCTLAHHILTNNKDVS